MHNALLKYMEETELLIKAKCIYSCDEDASNLEISMVYTSTVAVVHSINELLKVSPSTILVKFSIFSLQKYGNGIYKCKQFFKRYNISKF